MDRIRIFDTTLRDGEQSPGATLTPDEKLRVAHQLDALGVDVLEAGFPASSPGDFNAVRKIVREVRRPTIAALARATTGDVERAGAALAGAENARIHTFIATSDIHLRHKLRIDRRECIERAVSAVRQASRFTEDVEFSAEDATRTDPAFLCRIVEAAIEAGATTINIPDTVGYSYPDEFRRIIEALFAAVHGIDDVTVSVHCHDDLGLAVANSLAAIQAGARQIECTVNGIGERAGNAALEEVVMALQVRRADLRSDTGIHTREIYDTSRMLSRLTGIRPQANKAVVGENAFAHEAGIHQDGMLKDRQTYEIMTPRMVGVPRTRLVLGKHSGRRALARRYRELGYELDEYDLDNAYRLFKPLADRKKAVIDEDLISILEPEGFGDVERVHRLDELSVTCGGDGARVRLRLVRPDGLEREAEVEAAGPMPAVFRALDSVSEFRTEIGDIDVQAATPGRDAATAVELRARVEGKMFTGRGTSPDITRAAARAYLQVLDKAVQARRLEARALEKSGELWGV